MCVSLFFKFAHVWGQKTLRQWNLSHPHLFSRWSRRSRAMMFRCTVVFFWKYGAPFRVLSLKIYCSPRHAAIKLVYPKFSRTNSYPIVLYNYIPINSLICSYLHYICIYIYIPYYIRMYPLHMSLMFTLKICSFSVKHLVPHLSRPRCSSDPSIPIISHPSRCYTDPRNHG